MGYPKKGFMFGHHADFYMGRDWLYDKTKTQSDTYNVCGDYPGVLGIDFAKMIDDRYSDSKEHNENFVIVALMLIEEEWLFWHVSTLIIL